MPELALLDDREHPAWQRLKFEELLAQQLSQLQAKRERERQRAPAFALRPGGLQEVLLAALPFALTNAQRRVGAEIAADLGRAVPMHRLLQGDVGSGKTVVAALAAAIAIDAGWQCALMAPTEILAEQHLRKLVGWLAPLGVQVAWLTGSRKGKARSAMLEQVASGEAGLVVGTHAVIQEQVAFARLGLAIVDEQHRFGVQQRLALRSKLVDANAAAGSLALEPHTLMMSATPIPRTLAMTLFADLDISTLDELPPGRTPIVTKLFADAKRDAVIERIRDEVGHGRQVYWVCPLIEESETPRPAERDRGAPPALRRAAGPHRRPAARPHAGAEKAAAMALFTAGQMAVLVSTTGDRGRRRRAECVADGDRACRALRPVAAPPAARPHRPRLDRERLRAALQRAALADREGAPEDDARDAGRLRDRAPRPRDPRARRVPRRAPVGRAAAAFCRPRARSTRWSRRNAVGTRLLAGHPAARPRAPCALDGGQGRVPEGTLRRLGEGSARLGAAPVPGPSRCARIRAAVSAGLARLGTPGWHRRSSVIRPARPRNRGRSLAECSARPPWGAPVVPSCPSPRALSPPFSAGADDGRPADGRWRPRHDRRPHPIFSVPQRPDAPRRAVSLRQRLLLLTAGALLPLALAAGLALQALLDQQRQQTEQSSLDLTRALATAVDTELRLTISALQALAATEPIASDHPLDIEPFYRLARRVLTERPEWRAILLADRTGKVLFSTNYPLGGEQPTLAEADSFAATVNARTPQVGNLARGVRGQAGIPVRIPILRDGEVDYVLTAVVKPDAILRVVQQQRAPADWVVSVFDAKNARVARSRDHERQLGTQPTQSLVDLQRRHADEGTGKSVTLEGDHVFTAFTRLKSIGWTIALVCRPRSPMRLAPVGDRLWRRHPALARSRRPGGLADRPQHRRADRPACANRPSRSGAARSRRATSRRWSRSRPRPTRWSARRNRASAPKPIANACSVPNARRARAPNGRSIACNCSPAPARCCRARSRKRRRSRRSPR
jgi:hypothetical protein